MTVIVNMPPYTTASVDFVEGETISELVQRIKDDQKLEFRGSWSVQDVHDAGRVVDPSELVNDERLYSMNVMIAS
jgi:hypothetical protein